MPRPVKGERTPGSGRAPGTPNKTTRAIKEVLAKILEEPRSEQKLRELRDADNPIDRATFWRLAGKLIPAEVHAKVEAQTRLTVVDLSDQRKDPDGLAEG